MTRTTLGNFVCVVALVAAFHLTSPSANAEVRLAGFFGDHMVVQADKKIQLWGWAEPNESVSIDIEGEDVQDNVKASDDGKWKASLPARKASKKPIVLNVRGDGNTITLKDVLVGEVWLCSGQSNMEWPVSRSSNANEEITAGDHPLIRHIKVAHRPSTTPLDDLESEWQICSPDTVANFTACGYFMARQLRKELDVPIGLVNSSWGGTRVEPWTPPVGFAKVEALAGIHQSVLNRTPGTDSNKRLLEKHVADVESWLVDAKKSLSGQAPIAASPTYPAELTPFKSHQDPTMLYNGMIHALVGLPIRGAIWYQGESNHNEGMLYTEKKKALINGWRELWGQGDFPFYFVQIAPYQYGNESPSILASFWEAQAAVQQIPNTAMVVINDIATLNDIHPPNKQDVGHRLALLALKHDYGREVVAHSPEMESIELLGEKLKVNFKNTGSGMKTADGASPTHFQLIGPGSKGFQDADAIIDGDSVVLSSDKVTKPTAMRFAWHKLAEPNLVGGTGLPVGAFRAGEEPDLKSLLSIDSEYQLVYELDLSKLGRKIEYQTDNSSTIGDFSRIGYFVELRSDSRGEQAIFVSMDAFTDDADKIAVPTVASGADFRTRVKNMEVYSTVDGIVTGTGIASGNIEFWPNNYGPQNSSGIPAATGKYDFGDSPGPPTDGYGSMQVHNFGARQTLFSINNWKAGGAADIGIGNSPSEHPDWTFTGNASSYSKKHLRIYVK